MSEAEIDKFFETARERYGVLLRRRWGLPKPWSNDPVFQTEYFCNVFRTDDRTTMWFQKNILQHIHNDPRKALLAITAFRWFNKIETGERIKPLLLGEWDSVKAYNLLSAQKPVVTGAYIIKTPDGMTKLKGVLWCIEEFIKLMNVGGFDKLLNCKATMQEAATLLKDSPYLGNFMSWQICSDARQTCLLYCAMDRDTWAQPGPGSARGLGRVFHNDPNFYNCGGKGDEAKMLSGMKILAECSRQSEYWPQDWPPMAVIDVSHWLCEYDKYIRCGEGGRMKRKYNARG